MTDGPGFAALLRGLDRSALEELLARREEAAELSNGTSPRFEDLGAALSRPHWVGRAVGRLDAFLLPLLHVLVWFGPVVPRTTLRGQTPGVEDVDLARGLDELARWGLAFPSRRSREPDIVVPACVRTSIDRPAGLGPRAAELLGAGTVDTLLGVARSLGLEWRTRPRKDELLSAVVDRLSQSGSVFELLAAAPEGVAELLSAIRSTGGFAGAMELQELGVPSWRLAAWSYEPIRRAAGLSGRPADDSGPLAGLSWLRERALVATIPSSYGGVAGVAIPAEVELAFRGGILFDTWDLSPPPASTGPVFDAANATGPVDPSRAVAELSALLDEWTVRPMASLKRGGAGVRDLRRSAKAIGLDERQVQFLYALAVELAFVAEQGGSVRPTDRAQAWTRDEPSRQWAALFEAWRRARLWREDGQGGLVPLGDVNAILGSALSDEVRSVVLETLASAPMGHGFPQTMLGAAVAWRRPALFHCTECAEIASRRVVDGLVWLGTAVEGRPSRDPAVNGTTVEGLPQGDRDADANEPWFALAEPARSALADPGWVSGGGPAIALFHQPVATCTVQADLRVIVPGPPVRELAEALSRFADIERSSPARVYRLSEASIRRALDGGAKARDLLDILERSAPKGIPQNVAFLIEDVARRHGTLVAGTAGLFVKSDDPGILAAVASDRRLVKLRPRLLAPTVLAVEETRMDRLLAALRAAGYMPVGEPDESDRAESEEARGIMAPKEHPLLPPRELIERYRQDRGTRGPSPWGPAEAASLAGRLLASRRSKGKGPSLPSDRPAARPVEDQFGMLVRAGKEVKRMLERAAHEGLAVRLSYRSGSGKATVRDVEPMTVTSRTLDGWCRLRGDMRSFQLSRVEWAALTGERFEPDAVWERFQERLGL